MARIEDNGSRIFDRAAVTIHRHRAAARFAEHDFLARAISEQLGERLADINRKFADVLSLGGHCVPGAGDGPEKQRNGFRVSADLSEKVLRATDGPRVAASEEFLPFADNSFDLVIGGLTLHWVNDLPGALIQIRRTLRPDGLFLAAMFGGETLPEMRAAFLAAESELEGGASPRISPFADVRSAGGLLQRAGFAMPVVDSEKFVARYDSAFSLMRELRGMGEGNALLGRRKAFSRRQTLLAAAQKYDSKFAQEDGRIPATFEILWLTGWAPHPEQPKPLRPGSAATRLADALGTTEYDAGDKAAPDKGPARD